MNKTGALISFNNLSAKKLSVGSTHFLNLNKKKSVWWFDISLNKIISEVYPDLNLLLYDENSKELHHLKVPTKYLNDNISRFFLREDKQTISLELSSLNGGKFHDVRPKSGKVNLSKYFVQTFIV